MRFPLRDTGTVCRTAVEKRSRANSIEHRIERKSASPGDGDGRQDVIRRQLEIRSEAIERVVVLADDRMQYTACGGDRDGPCTGE
jgi:hypothetical protein